MELEEVGKAGVEGILTLALDPTQALGLPTYSLTSDELAKVCNGSPFAPSEHEAIEEGQRVSLVHDTRLYGVWALQNGLLRAQANCPLGIEGVRA